MARLSKEMTGHGDKVRSLAVSPGMAASPAGTIAAKSGSGTDRTGALLKKLVANQGGSSRLAPLFARWRLLLSTCGVQRMQ